MNRKTFRHSLLLSALLAASAAFANNADIVKCVDQDGRVTLTDNQCSAGVETVLMAGSASAAQTPDEVAAQVTVDTAAPAAAPVTRRVAPQRVASVAAPVQHVSWSAPRPNSRMLARDVETLKAARLSMKVLDEASASAKSQRMAGLN